MKKSYTLLLCCLFTFSITSAQIDFFNNSDLFSEEILFNVIEDDEGDFIMVGRVKELTNSYSIGYVIRLSDFGNIKNQFVYNNEGDGLILNEILFFNNKYTFLGAHQKENKEYLYITQFDKFFNLIYEKTYQVPSNKKIAYFKSIINTDSNIVIAGHTFDSFNNFITNQFYSLLTYDGDLIQTIYKDQPCPTCMPKPYQIHESYDSSKYYVMTSGYKQNFANAGILQLSTNFDTIEFNLIDTFLLNHYSSIKHTDSLFIISGIGITSEYKLYISIVNEQGISSNMQTFQKEIGLREHPALIKGISKFNNSIFIGATSNCDYSNPFFSSIDSWYHLIKFDDTLNVIWEKWYGGDAYYFLNSVLATSDGGCLMVGTKYPHGLSTQTRVAHFIKVDANGNVQWTQDIETHDISFNLYPNPTSSFFTIENKNFSIEKIELFDLSGKIISVIDNCENANIQLNLEPYPKGIYLAKIITSKGITTQKVVKQ